MSCFFERVDSPVPNSVSISPDRFDSSVSPRASDFTSIFEELSNPSGSSSHEAATSLPAPPNQTPNFVFYSLFVPGGGLNAHEGFGGHTVERHVFGEGNATTLRALADRFIGQTESPDSSAFYSRAQANHVIASALREKQPEIDGWLNGTQEKSKVFSLSLDFSSGYSVLTPDYRTCEEAGSRLFMKLIRDENCPLGYYIRTCYPQR